MTLKKKLDVMLKKPSGAAVWFLFFILVAAVFPLQQETGFISPISQFRLKNGLEVVLSEDDALPLVSVVMAYHAGSINEEPGKAGLSYLLENIMFLGSSNVGPMQHISHISRVGGEPNASTTEDITYFYQTVPSNQLALVLWLESDRLKALEIDAAKVERAKQAILDEIRQRRAAEPYLESALAFDQTLYPDFSRGHSILGREEDIRNLRLEDVKNFYSSHYVPNNAVLVIVGDINIPKTRELVEKFFEGIPSVREPPSPPPAPPPERKEVTQVFQEVLAPSPAFHLGYRVAAPYTQDYYTMVIIDYILLKGESSRLRRKLVKKESLAVHLSGGIEKRKDFAAFKIFAVNNNERMVELCQKGTFSEINRLRTSYVSEAELQKAKNLFKRDYVHRLSIPAERAMFLAEMFFSPVDLKDVPGELAKYLRVTPFEVIGIANRYLVPENSVILNVRTR
jgi:zinc protease